MMAVRLLKGQNRVVFDYYPPLLKGSLLFSSERPPSSCCMHGGRGGIRNPRSGGLFWPPDTGCFSAVPPWCWRLFIWGQSCCLSCSPCCDGIPGRRGKRPGTACGGMLAWNNIRGAVPLPFFRLPDWREKAFRFEGWLTGESGAVEWFHAVFLLSESLSIYAPRNP